MSDINDEMWVRIVGFPDMEDFPKYKVSNKGRIYSEWTNKCLIPNTDKDGYKTVTLINKDRKQTHRLHRLVGLAFKREEYKPGYTINHDDFDKANNKASNLEWMSMSDNLAHSHQKFRNILVRNIKTGEVKKFSTGPLAARCMDIDQRTLQHRLQYPPYDTWNQLWQVKKSDDDRPWSYSKSVAHNFDQGGRPVIIRYIKENLKEVEYPSIADAVKVLNVPSTTVKKWLTLDDHYVLPDYIQIKYKDDIRPWRELPEPLTVEVARRQDRRGQKLMCHDVNTDKRVIYASVKQAGDLLGINPKRIGDMLRRNHTKTNQKGQIWKYI